MVILKCWLWPEILITVILNHRLLNSLTGLKAYLSKHCLIVLVHMKDLKELYIQGNKDQFQQQKTLNVNPEHLYSKIWEDPDFESYTATTITQSAEACGDSLLHLFIHSFLLFEVYSSSACDLARTLLDCTMRCLQTIQNYGSSPVGSCQKLALMKGGLCLAA